LDNNYISSIHRDLHGIMWFGTMHGIFWYDGKNFHKLHIKLGSSDVLQGASFYAIHGDSNGVMWFGTADIEREAERGEGVLIYDGEEFTRITTEGGLANGGVCAIHRDQDGIMWFGTTMGVYRYGGENISRFTKKDGLANNYVNVIHCDPDGTVWFGTQDGVSRYAGKEFFNFTTEDGLAHNDVNAIYRDASGIIWFATYGGGVSGYDGIAWITLDTRDGLAGKTVTSILEDKDGFLWFGTDEGVTRYRRSISKPKVYIVSVTADQTYTDFSAIPAFTPGTRITVEYSSIDFKTLPAKRQYRYRIKETDSDWRKPTKETSSDFIFDNPGTYTFEVQAIDRDLNYSEPMSLKLEVIPDPRNHQIAQLKGELAERERAEMQRMQQELDDAHDMQMSLMPGKPPILEGFEIAGFSKPAREVGGDFFDYFTTVDGKTGIALADVSGKGLKGAMNAVLANGIIHEVARTRNSCGSILRALNDSLCPRMMKLMFIAVELVIIDKDNMTMQWANAGQPYPIVRRKGKAFELVTDNEIPAGIMRDITYSDRQFSFESGDVVVFYTDGLMEAENEAGEMYGSERLQQTMMDINSMESPEEIIKVILQSISDFVGEAEQYDDMTIVVIKRK